jgi:hypothetical protein
MVDIDLNDIHILSSQDIDLAKVSHVKNVESQNASLKYGLIVCCIFIGGFLFYLYRENRNNLKR